MSRELLSEVIDHLPTDSDLRARVLAYLGAPVHRGDVISLVALPCGPDDWDGRPSWREVNPPIPDVLPEGVTPHRYRSRYRWDDEVQESEGVEYLLPEVAPPRMFTWAQMGAGIVVAINGIHYRLTISLDSEEGYGPTGAIVLFTVTDDPETEYTEFDRDGAREAELDRLRQRVERLRGPMSEDPEWSDMTEDRPGEWDNYRRQDLERAEIELFNLENGSSRMRPTTDVQVFGRPEWIQNSYIPIHEDRTARCLAVLNTGHGDCGNVNLLFACDEQGVPCRVWFESSMH